MRQLCQVPRNQTTHFMSKTDPEFNSFRTALDNLCKRLSGNGIGVDASHTEGISADEKNRVRESGVLNTNTPLSLLQAFFMGLASVFAYKLNQI